MDITALKRQPSKIHENLHRTNKGTVVTKGGCKIYIPARWGERGLAVVGAETLILGLCAITVDDKFYGVCNVNAQMPIAPSSTNMVDVDGDQYYEFVFDKGSTVITNENLVRKDTLLYEIYNELIAKGRVPWYLNYEDMGKLFISAKHHAGVGLVASNSILEMIVAAIARNPKDRAKFYRHYVSSMEEQTTKPPAFVPFRSPIFSATNTTAKIIGAYFDDSLSSALVNPSEQTEGVERLLRS